MTTNRFVLGGFMFYLSSTRITSVVFVLVLLICPAWGQISQRSSISGIVTDTSNAVVAGAKVTLKDLDRSRDSLTTTDDAGRYNLLTSPRHFIAFSSSPVVSNPTATSNRIETIYNGMPLS
jgi:hypothetical protein